MLLALGLLACLAFWWLSKTGEGFGKRLGRALGRGLGAAAGPTLASKTAIGPETAPGPETALGRKTPPAPKTVAGSVALAAAGLLLLHGNFALAGLLGLGGIWMLEGADGIGRRLKRLLPAGPGIRPEAVRVYRTGVIAMSVGPDGSLRHGQVITGPGAGTCLDDLSPEAVVELLRFCDRADPEGAALLEAYLDRRTPGWRIHAERNRDPRTGRTPNPGAMTQEEAHQILGLQRGASPEEIRTAHRSLMKRAHPDQGGSAEGAARVNAARDRLLNRHR